MWVIDIGQGMVGERRPEVHKIGVKPVWAPLKRLIAERSPQG
jgi:hypothetical protein